MFKRGNTGYFSNQEDHFKIRVNTIAGVNGDAVEQNRENLVGYKDINQAVNDF